MNIFSWDWAIWFSWWISNSIQETTRSPLESILDKSENEKERLKEMKSEDKGLSFGVWCMKLRWQVLFVYLIDGEKKLQGIAGSKIQQKLQLQIIAIFTESSKNPTQK